MLETDLFSGSLGASVAAGRPMLWQRQPAGVAAHLGYVDGAVERPVSYMYDPPDGCQKDNCSFDFPQLHIADARDAQVQLHREGFELWRAPSRVADFHDAAAVKQRYYAECAEIACAATGAASAVVFDHQVRVREDGRPPLSFGRSGDGTRPGGVGRVHNDYSEASGARRRSMADAAGGGTHPRFAIVNLWRSIRGPILDTPLAVCDARSVSVCDLVPAEIRYRDRTGEIYLVKASHQHRWFYFSEMTTGEVLIFKQYDSQVSGVSRFTPHAAFDLPHIPEGTPLRQSIEVRCLVLFD